MHRNKQIFFFISKILPKKRLFHAKRHEAARNYKEKRTKNCVHKKKESINIKRRSLDVSLQTWDQSNKVPINMANSWFLELSTSSNVQLLHSLLIHHIKHNSVKFQMSDESFPNQFLYPKKRSSTLLGKTHKTLNDLKTKHHNR